MKLVNLFTVIALATISAAAHADGFTCQTGDGSINVKIFNNTNPQVGTRVGAVMVVSDPAISDGKKTIARFTDTNGTLESRSSKYVAKVDLRFNDSSLKGRNIHGTKLGNIDTITADIDFSYAAPAAAGEEVEGTLIIERRSGSPIQVDMTCSRYLKD
ncbi:MAG: hypothetical protein ACXVC0_05170 [Bdellovibrionota bacterium]